VNRRKLLWFLAAAPAVAAVGGTVAPVVVGQIKVNTYATDFEAIARAVHADVEIHYFERLPGETREEFEVRRRATIKPFAEGTI
jgi:hypothetical protein